MSKKCSLAFTFLHFKWAAPRQCSWLRTVKATLVWIISCLHTCGGVQFSRKGHLVEVTVQFLYLEFSLFRICLCPSFAWLNSDEEQDNELWICCSRVFMCTEATYWYSNWAAITHSLPDVLTSHYCPCCAWIQVGSQFRDKGTASVVTEVI